MEAERSIWICKKLLEDKDGEISYSAPVKYSLNFNYLTISPASGYLATLQYGEKIGKAWNIKAKKSVFERVFAEGDLLYIDGNTPLVDDENYVNGLGANAIVTSVLPYLVSISITVEKIQP
jgi:hypothetical protein